MNYRVLARRYRPQTFDDIVGQPHVVRTLLNAIRSDRVAHAYLFCGARGVGKTSAARIFAKTINCPNTKDNVPCCECEVCRAISEGEDIDVIEMDAASNRGIDDVRNLRENISFRPARSPNKVYIIDEVHMLTREAFNALLKTLEEPPDYVKFVFCTTEPERIPSTILSRCQRFDFHRLSVDDIQKQLGHITEKEGFRISDDALNAVARYARGGLRDSISVLEQLFSFSDNTIDINDVQIVLGAVSPENMRELVFACARGEADKAIEHLTSILDAGRDTLEVLDQLVEFLRDVLIATECRNNPELLSGWVSENDLGRPEFAELSYSTVVMMLNYLMWARPLLKEDSAMRVPLELAVVRMAHAGEVLEIPQVLKALGNTGKKILSEEDAGRLKEVRYSGVKAAPQQPEPKPEKKPKSEKKPTPAPEAKNAHEPPRAVPRESKKKVAETPPEQPEPQPQQKKQASPENDTKSADTRNEDPDPTAPIRELWYDFVDRSSYSKKGRAALKKCDIEPTGTAFTVEKSKDVDADSYRDTVRTFVDFAAAKGIKIEPPAGSLNIATTLEEVESDPVVQDLLELFPDAEIQKAERKDTEE
ncbi:MAG: DNA polymerase III subunit gamma/tau [Planctomycetota bacterium]|nr:DNA polymerase III subunit gamma/tau [Planctomycetota bacterium]